MSETAEQILARHAAERRILLEAQHERQAESRRRELAYRKSLPRLSYEPAGDPESGRLYVLATDRIEAFDGQRIFVAVTPGQWVEEGRARRLGLDGPAVLLVP